MEQFDISSLKRNSEKISTHFEVKNGITTVKNNVVVIFPEHFINAKLCQLGTTVNVLSLYAIVDEDDNYAVCSAPIIQTLTPSVIKDIGINGVNYKALVFNKDSVFLPNNNLIVRDDIIYNIVDELFIKGFVPWYLNYEDMGNLFIKSKQYTGNGIGNDPLTFEILASIVSRLSSDKKIYYRHKKDNDKSDPEYVGMNNPYYSFNNTGARLIGSRFGAGLNTALVEPETKSSATTEILTS